MAKIRRVVTIVMEIDTEKHNGRSKMKVREDGKVKKFFTLAQAVTTARALSLHADELLGLTMEPLIAIGENLDENGNLTLYKNETE